jgi:VWFA-related protein
LAILLIGLAFIGLGAHSALRAQARFEVHVVQVPLLVSVTDSRGRLITSLNRQDFKVYEGTRLQKVESFSRETDLPLSIALLIDQSTSAADNLEFERAAAMQFFSNIVKPGKDRALVVGFATNAHLLVDFTDDLDKLEAGLKKLSADGSTAVYDSIYLASEQKLAKEQGERRKVIILISDGDDTASRYDLKQALESVQKRDALIYAISTNRTTETKSDERERGDKTIRQLVDETGGRAYFPAKLSDLSAEFKKIETELRSQYSLSYSPTNPFDGTYRKLRVEIADKSFKARTRAGYIASRN